MNLYLDINGVLVTRDLKPTNHVTEFLQYATEKYTCFWLTTHCRGGSNRCIETLREILPSQALWHAKKILPTDWKTFKTEAIMWDQDFRWLDDVLLDAEKQALVAHGALEKYIPVDLGKNRDQLRDLINIL